MQKNFKILAAILAVCLGFGVANASDADLSKFRFSLEEMQDIASASKLKWRIFYDKPSVGKDAQWFDAVKQGNLQKVKQMAENGQNLEAKDEANLGQTALGWAAFIGYEDMVDYLIKQGADIFATDRGDVYNSLKSAVLGKNVNIVRKIHAKIEEVTGKKVDFNDQSVEDDAETLLIVAASNNRIDTAKYLLAQGANVNLVAKPKDQSALSFACDNKHTQMVELLISHGAINHRNGKASCK